MIIGLDVWEWVLDGGVGREMLLDRYFHRNLRQMLLWTVARKAQASHKGPSAC